MKRIIPSLFLLILLPTALWASPLPRTLNIAIVTTEKHANINEALYDTLTHLAEAPSVSNVQILLLNAHRLDETPKALKHMHYIVSVGKEAASITLAEKPKAPLLSILLQEEDFKTLAAQYFPGKDPAHLKKFSSLYKDHPISRKLNLARRITPKDRNVGIIGVLLGPDSAKKRKTLEAEAQKRGLCLNIVQVKEHENPVDALNLLLEDSSILIAMPDKRVFNRHTARGMLLTAFRRHVPIIGYSKAYVDVGALASVYSSARQVANQTHDILMTSITRHQGVLATPQHPYDFNVAINRQVANSFSYTTDSELSVKYTLEDKENK